MYLNYDTLVVIGKYLDHKTLLNLSSANKELLNLCNDNHIENNPILVINKNNINEIK